MAISQLPTSTIRALGASQALTDPTAVIKELIDNALDAGATNISIEISANTLDVLQVRDNGHGIPAEDRPLVARPHCTSKIADLDDLRAVGGSSLGFRGEALASIAELSGALTVSTRVEGEAVATVLKISRQGEVVGRERCSLPVGTTVRVEEFLKTNVVRQRQSLKTAEKCLKRVKLTLQAYAFARVGVRFSLRVTKAKSPLADWIFAPAVTGDLQDAARRIIGSACASQCELSVFQQDGYSFQALLPRLDADAAKFSAVGAFLSIDGRPVSSVRGTAKQVIKVYRDVLKNANPAFSGVGDPFICLQIRCPPSSYEANIEPEKDDVLFADPELILSLAESLFETAYPTRRASDDTDAPDLAGGTSQFKSTRPCFPSGVSSTRRQNNEASSERSQHIDDVSSTSRENYQFSTDESQKSANVSQAARNNMYGFDNDDDLEMLLSSSQALDNELDVGLDESHLSRSKDMHLSNPWIIAKMNASLRTPFTFADQRPVIDLERSTYSTPGSSSPAAKKPLFDPSHNIHFTRNSMTGKEAGADPLPPPVPLTPSSSPYRQSQGRFDSNFQSPSRAAEAPFPPPVTYRRLQQPDSSTTQPSPSQSQKSPKKYNQTRLNKPFVQPTITHPDERGKVWFDHLERYKTPRSNRKGKVITQSSQAGSSQPLVTREDADEPPTSRFPTSMPPAGNRDVRSFFTPINRLADDLTVGFTASRNHGTIGQGRLASFDDHLPAEINDENVDSSRGNELDFVPAKKIAALETHTRQLTKSGVASSTRRKKSIPRVLRERSTNSESTLIDDNDDAEDDQQRLTYERLQPKKSASGKLRRITRTRSSRLPLERVAEGQAMQNIVFSLPIALEDVSRDRVWLDIDRSAQRWNQGLETHARDDTLAFADPAEVADLALRVKELLIFGERIPSGGDGDEIRDIGQALQDAFDAHRRILEDLDERNKSEC